MGRKTAESIGRALPGRKNLVLTRSGKAPFVDMIPVASLDEAMALAGDRLFVIGGGEVYAMALPCADMLHLTHVEIDLPQKRKPSLTKLELNLSPSLLAVMLDDVSIVKRVLEAGADPDKKIVAPSNAQTNGKKAIDFATGKHAKKIKKLLEKH